jgi:hypothetical protein
MLVHLTIAELAEALERHGRVDEQPQPVAGPELQPFPRDQQLQLSFAQERLWLAHKLVPDSPMYNLPAVVRLSGPLNTRALEQSLNEICRRHEVLRTSFPFVNGRPVQEIAPARELSLEMIDCSAWPTAEREGRARQLTSAEAQRAFNLEQDSMFRATLLRLDHQDHIFVLTLHHIISDAWSMNILIGELGALYEACAHDRPSLLPELPIQYADFAQWQRRLLQGASLDSLLTYWKQRMAGAPLLTQFHTDRPRPPRQTFNGARQSISLPTELSQSLKALSRGEGVTLYTLLLAAFKTLLYRFTGQSDLVVGTPIAGRSRPEIEGLIGCFINTLAMRTDLSGNPRFRELLGRVWQTTLGAYSHQDLPFEKMLEVLQVERDLSYSPVIQILFDFINTPPSRSLELSELTLVAMSAEIGTAKTDLVIDMWEMEERLTGSVEYNTDLFDSETITRLLSRYEILLNSIVAKPDTRLNALEILTHAEQEEQLSAAAAREAAKRKKFGHIKPKPLKVPAHVQ